MRFYKVFLFLLAFAFLYADESQKDLATLQSECDSDNFESCADLGLLYDEGKGVKKDYAKAMELYQKACDNGNALGCRKMGKLYEDGSGVKKDLNKAVESYEKACEGSSAECLNIGILYYYGTGVKQDYKKAFELFERSCTAGNPRGCRGLGRLYDKGLGVEIDKNEALKYYEMACDGEDSLCFDLGLLYYNGIPATKENAYGESEYYEAKDWNKAEQAYTKACNVNDYSSCHNLAVIYNQRQEYHKAKDFYKKACDNNNFISCSNLGRLYENGQGVKVNLQTAIQLYTKACNGKDANGCFNLGSLYYNGKGVKKNITKAKEYYGKACDLGAQAGCDAYKNLTQASNTANTSNTAAKKPRKSNGVCFTTRKGKLCDGDRISIFSNIPMEVVAWKVNAQSVQWILEYAGNKLGEIYLVNQMMSKDKMKTEVIKGKYKKLKG